MQKELKMTKIIETLYNFLWGDLFTLNIAGTQVGVSLLVLLLIPAGIFFTVRTRFMPVRKLPQMIRALTDKSSDKSSLSTFQTLIISTATRVGMGNLVGVVAAVSVGGAGSVFWMWISAFLGASTAYAEGTLAQLHKKESPLYGGYQGGPAYYIHDYIEEKRKKKIKKSILAILFSLFGLICWCGISQVISNSVSSAFENAFDIPPIYTTVILVAISAIIVLRKNATVKILDIIVPVMAVAYFAVTMFIIIKNYKLIPSVFERIFQEAFGIRQIAGGGFGAVLMNGIKRGLFSNEAGSGSAPCAAAAAQGKKPETIGMVQALGVLIDTVVICTCTAMIILLVPENITSSLQGMELLQSAMNYHIGPGGTFFIAVILFLFSFSTFLGILFYARSNVSYICGNNWWSQTLYKIVALVMLFIGGLQAYTVVWDLGDLGIGLMTIINLIILVPMSKEAIKLLDKKE